MENKTGPKPKQLKPKEIWGIEIGRGDNKNIVPPEDVYKLKAIGCTNAEIAAFYGVQQDTLQRNFASELAKAQSGARSDCAKQCLKMPATTCKPQCRYS